VEGGDALFLSTSFQPEGAPQADTAVDPSAKPSANNTESKTITSANGERVAFRPVRTKLQKRVAVRKQMADNLKARIEKAIEEGAKHTSFSTKAR
jgi:hypothetical protein